MLEYTVSVKQRKLKNRKIIVSVEKYIYIRKYTHTEKNHKGTAKVKNSYYIKVARLCFLFVVLFHNMAIN